MFFCPECDFESFEGGRCPQCHITLAKHEDEDVEQDEATQAADGEDQQDLSQPHEKNFQRMYAFGSGRVPAHLCVAASAEQGAFDKEMSQTRISYL